MQKQTKTGSNDNPNSQEPTNRRATIRYQCAPATLGKVISPHREDFVRAFVLDLSKNGAGLLLSRKIPAGQEVMIQISNPHTNEKHEFAAKVAHTTSQPHGDWKVGCRFMNPLTDDQLEHLL